MADLEIRINKRTFERIVYIIIIIALAVLLFLNWGPGEPSEPTVDVTALETNVTLLTAELATCNAQKATCEETLTSYEEAEAERDAVTDEPEVTVPDEPAEEELSGEITTGWRIMTDPEDDTKVDSIAVVITNGLEHTEVVEYKLYWESLGGNVVKYESDVSVKSGAMKTFTIEPQEVGFRSRAPDEPDSLVLELRDSDGDLIDRLEEEVG